jgi:hypothetical protein
MKRLAVYDDMVFTGKDEKFSLKTGIEGFDRVQENRAGQPPLVKVST